MAISTSLKEGAIRRKGGGRVWIKRVSDTSGTATSPADTWHLLGYMKDFEISDNTPLEDDYDDRGVNHPQDGNRKVMMNVTLMQRDDASLTLAIRDIAPTEYVEIIREHSSEKIDNKYQYIVTGPARVMRGMTHRTPGNNIQVQFQILENASEITVDTASVTGMLATTFPASVTIPAANPQTGDGYWVLSSAS
jgi:hypothetical protein